MSTTPIQEVCDILSKIWYLEVLCLCIDAGAPACQGESLSFGVHALGEGMAVGWGTSIAGAHPTALTDDWTLGHRNPLMIFILRGQGLPSLDFCGQSGGVLGVQGWDGSPCGLVSFYRFWLGHN